MISSIFSFRSLGYLIFAVMVAALVLFARFPAEKIKYSCEKRIERLLPGSSCHIGEVAFTFPLSVIFKNIKVSREINGQKSIALVDSLILSPKPLQFWKAYSLTGALYSGQLEAELAVDREAETFQLTAIHLKGLQVGGFTESIGLTERKISGLVNFSGEYLAKSEQPGQGTGKGQVQVSGGSMQLLQPILALQAIEFNKVTMKVSQEKGLLRIDEGKLLGKELQTDFTGELQLASPLLNSRLLLTGQMTLDKEYLGSNPKEQKVVQRLLKRYKTTALPFKVGGTVKRPLFRFSK